MGPGKSDSYQTQDRSFRGAGDACKLFVAATVAVSSLVGCAVSAQNWTEQTNGGMGQIFSPAVRDEQLSNPQVKELFSQSVHLLKTNKAYQARELLERALTLAPHSASIHCNLGLAYQNSGNMQRAVDEFKSALSLNPHMPEATLNLAGCYQSIGANQDAIHWYMAYLNDTQLNQQQRKQVTDIVSSLQSASARPNSDPRADDYLSSVTADGAFRWAPDKLPIRIFVQNAIVDKAGNPIGEFKQEFQEVLLKSFDEWCKATDGRVSFETVADKEHADIFCTWTVDPSEVAENGTLSERGSAKVIVKGDHIERATLKILVRPILDEGTLSKDELMKACLHEVGHVLGLQGHSTNNHDVMFTTVDTSTVWPVLSKRDRATIAKLYESYPHMQSTRRSQAVHATPARAQSQVRAGANYRKQNPPIK